jgi:hypothetical protein
MAGRVEGHIFCVVQDFTLLLPETLCLLGQLADIAHSFAVEIHGVLSYRPGHTDFTVGFLMTPVNGPQSISC